MKRVLLCLVLFQGLALRANVYNLTIETLKQINAVESGKLSEVTERVEAILFDYQKTLDELLDNGKDINARENGGITALMKASIASMSAMVSILLDCGAYVEPTDDNGFTAMMHFVKHWIVQEEAVYCIQSTPVIRTYQNPEKCIELLLGAGAESLELALLSVERFLVQKDEAEQAQQYEGFKRLLTHITLKLNPKTLLEKTKRRIRMSRLRNKQ